MFAARQCECKEKTELPKKTSQGDHLRSKYAKDVRPYHRSKKPISFFSARLRPASNAPFVSVGRALMKHFCGTFRAGRLIGRTSRPMVVPRNAVLNARTIPRVPVGVA